MMYKLETKNYIEILSAAAQKANDRLEKYRQDPSKENVHEARTSIRRLESAWTILPRKIRQKRKLKKFVSAYKKCFTANSDIRDSDIIQQRLRSLPVSTDDLSKILYERKMHALDAAMKRAKAASRTKFPKISQDSMFPPKLEKRFRKVTSKLIDNIQRMIPVVVTSEKRVTELHKLRKDCKKLRYLIELIPAQETTSVITRLKQMQDLLGLIRDSDITIDFLKEISPKHTGADEMIVLESQNRTFLYNKFVQTHKSLEVQN